METLAKLKLRENFLCIGGKEEAPRIKVGTCSFITHLFSICERVRRSKELHKKCVSSLYIAASLIVL